MAAPGGHGQVVVITPAPGVTVIGPDGRRLSAVGASPAEIALMVNPSLAPALGVSAAGQPMKPSPAATGTGGDKAATVADAGPVDDKSDRPLPPIWLRVARTPLSLMALLGMPLIDVVCGKGS